MHILFKQVVLSWNEIQILQGMGGFSNNRWHFHDFWHVHLLWNSSNEAGGILKYFYFNIELQRLTVTIYDLYVILFSLCRVCSDFIDIDVCDIVRELLPSNVLHSYCLFLLYLVDFFRKAFQYCRIAWSWLFFKHEMSCC